MDNVLAGISSQVPLSFAWDTTGLANGLHTLHSLAYDSAGNTGASSDVSVDVENNAAVSYTGTWTASSAPNAHGGAYRYARTAGASSTFTFSGARTVALLSATGADEGKFTRGAVKLIHAATQGVPQAINDLCDSALLLARTYELPGVDEEAMRRVLSETPMAPDARPRRHRWRPNGCSD